MLIENKSVAIVGGGPGGLTLARLLQMQGGDVKVYERDVNRNARVQGSPLDMHEASGMIAIHKADLVDAFYKNVHVGADKKIIVNERADIYFSDHHIQQDIRSANKHARPEISRGRLRKILLTSLHPETVVWDCHFASMKAQKKGWLLHFKNGSSAYADIVIAADGAHSKIRPYITTIKPLYSGITMLEININDAATTTPHIYSLLNGGKVMAFGNAQCILGGQKEDGNIGFYLSFKTDEGWATNNGLNYYDKAQMLDWFKTTYTSWSPVWYDLITNATPPFIPRPIYYMPLQQTWETLPNLTMLGDAAHVMPPFAGEGANMAMLDAVELSECLTGNTFQNMQEAISVYETRMRKRAAEAIAVSLQNGDRMHSKEALSTMLQVFSKT